MAKRGQTRNYRVKYRHEHPQNDPNGAPITGTIVCDTEAAAEREARMIRAYGGSATVVDVRAAK